MLEHRLETKIVIHQSELSRAQAIIASHGANFQTAFPNRRVNNIYFDTPSKAFLQAHLAGNKSRQKIRVRWYDDDNKYFIESKKREGAIGSKSREEFKLKDLDHLERLDWQAYSLVPSLKNSYLREYYEAKAWGVRLTLDTQLSFAELPMGLVYESKLAILEFKYSPEIQKEANKIIGLFPWRISKSSKYVLGSHPQLIE